VPLVAAEVHAAAQLLEAHNEELLQALRFRPFPMRIRELPPTREPLAVGVAAQLPVAVVAERVVPVHLPRPVVPPQRKALVVLEAVRLQLARLWR
jgi:hypothetical protein